MAMPPIVLPVYATQHSPLCQQFRGDNVVPMPAKETTALDEPDIATVEIESDAVDERDHGSDNDISSTSSSSSSASNPLLLFPALTLTFFCFLFLRRISHSI